MEYSRYKGSLIRRLNRYHKTDYEISYDAKSNETSIIFEVKFSDGVADNPELSEYQKANILAEANREAFKGIFSISSRSNTEFDIYTKKADSGRYFVKLSTKRSMMELDLIAFCLNEMDQELENQVSPDEISYSVKLEGSTSLTTKLKVKDLVTSVTFYMNVCGTVRYVSEDIELVDLKENGVRKLFRSLVNEVVSA